ncbi:MAG: GNAT family N-acetyltransferase [Eubacteriales bacterium]
MELETERLRLIALKPRQLKCWVDDITVIERELDVVYMAEPLNGIFLEIVKGQIDRTEKDSENYLWHSYWLLVRKNDKVVVGSADFKDIPNDVGEVEIGYGLGKDFEHNGYMTEAVKAMCKWALQQERVLHVIAETDLDGLASQRVLQRNGFVETKRNETVWWKL